MRFVIGFCAALFLASSNAGRADVLVELFTSQGCSSCPPADSLLAELAEHEDVVALAYHVDYWDYLGWKDTFARPEFSARQRQYSKKTDRQWIGRKMRGLFTPEIVVQGKDSLVGSSRAGVIGRVAAHAAQAPAADLRLERDGKDLIVSIRPTGSAAGAASILLARYTPSQSVMIKRGENAGKTVSYTHIVTHLDVIGEWNGRDARQIRVGQTPGPVVVFAQGERLGPVIAVAQMP